MNPCPRVAWLLPTLSAVALLACNDTKLDQDGDGFTELTGDCDDLDANVHPDAVEVCYNDIDDNCNGVEDEEGATSGRIFYVDLDGDGYGNETVTLSACEQPENYAENKWDCNESDPAIHPAATEICDFIDNDCDGQVDESSAEGALRWMQDLDGDGYGDDTAEAYSCTDPGDGWSNIGGDCNDSDPLTNPDQQESCFSAQDDNCDGNLNEADAYGCVDYYADADGDGFPGTEACLCEPDEDHTALESTDCDDENADRYPGSPAPDVGWRSMDCDSQVDMEIDEADLSFQTSPYYLYDNRTPSVETFAGGDLDGDGLADFVVGARNWTGTVAYVAIAGSSAGFENQHDLSTQAHAILVEETDSSDGHTIYRGASEWGTAVTDINGDGIDDLLTPRLLTIDDALYADVAVFLGPVSGSLDWSQADATYRATEAMTSAANGLLSAGQHPDGRTLVAVGDSTETRGANAYVGRVDYLGWDAERSALTLVDQVYGREPSQQLGANASSLGDLNGDGLDDRVVTARGSTSGDAFGEGYSAGGGVLSIYTDHTAEADSHIVSNVFYREIVERLGGPGDLNGDGHPDIVFAPATSPIGAYDAGRAHVVWGPLAEGVSELVDLPQVVLIGDETYQNVNCPAVLGDTDGDGRAELALGARTTVSDDPARVGATYIWLGRDTTGTHTVSEATTLIGGSNASDVSYQGTCQLSRSAHISPGDMNGDGLHDLVVRGTASIERDPDREDSIFTFYGVAE
jgi:hypothetical protein